MDGAVRRHKRLLAEALAAIRPATTKEYGSRRSEAQVAEGLLAHMDTGCLDTWPDDLGPQHPHPVWESIAEDTPVESINITSLKAAEGHLYRRHTAVFFQEHALALHVHRGWVKRARAKGYTLLLGPPDPEAALAKGGVGLLAPVDFRATEMPARTAAFDKARRLGRIMRVVLRTGHHVAITIYNVYGFPGGHQDKHKAGRTDAIVAAARQEMVERGDTYVAILGDFNAELEDLPSAHSLKLQAGWVDLGSRPA
jgi:hypothetical protein